MYRAQFSGLDYSEETQPTFYRNGPVTADEVPSQASVTSPKSFSSDADSSTTLRSTKLEFYFGTCEIVVDVLRLHKVHLISGASHAVALLHCLHKIGVKMKKECSANCCCYSLPFPLSFGETRGFFFVIIRVMEFNNLLEEDYIHVLCSIILLILFGITEVSLDIGKHQGYNTKKVQMLSKCKGVAVTSNKGFASGQLVRL